MSKKFSIGVSLITVMTVSLLVFAATPFTPREQPWGYVAPPAMSSLRLSSGSAVAYAPWFEIGSYQGDIYAYPVAASGAVDILSPLWSARAQLDTQNWDTGRRIVTTSDGTPVRFRWDSLNGAQQTALGSADVLNFIRGNRANEGTYRTRFSVLGDIVHSTPVYVGPPDGAYSNLHGYIAFSTGSAASRSERVYVGANDGMLHAFDADTGQEMFGYIPSMVVPNLSELKEPIYNHQYYVDGPLTAMDAYNGVSWKTILVGGLGAGGKGFFALDVTDPTTLTTSESNVANKVLWEYHEGSANGGSLLGYTYSRPSIVRLNSGGLNKDWAMIAGNGYMSAAGGASLHIRDVFTGAEIETMSVGTASTASPNGLSSPAVADLDGNGTADVVYAGDLDGNLWKFDISDSNSSNWTSTLFFRATDPSGNPQSIVAAPDLSYHSTLGVMVFVATGRLFSVADTQRGQVQSVYGLRDRGSVLLNPTLVDQTISAGTHLTGGQVATTTSLHITTQDGWRADLPVNQNVVQDIKILDTRVQFVAVDASTTNGENWLYELDYASGGSPGSTIMDVDNDLLLSEADNFDANGNSLLTDPEDVVVGLYQQAGLASRPTFTNKSDSAAVAIINHLTAIKPSGEPPRSVPPGEIGLVGGHFDLDTSNKTYAYNAGDTHNHDHEWDDDTGRIEVDFFEIVTCGNPADQSSCSSDPAHLEIPDAITSTQEFHLLVSNAELSPAAVLRINGMDISATMYQDQIQKALNDSARFPLTTYTRSGSSGTQLSSFAVSFDQWAIIDGGIIPTATGCVRGNAPGKLNEYRNGAFTVQAVRAGSFPSQVNETTGPSGGKIRNGKGSGLVKHVNGGNSALLWEATIFWHWDGDCYGQGNWDAEYADCFGKKGVTTNCTYIPPSGTTESGDTKTKDKDKDSGTTVSTTTVTVNTPMDPGDDISDTTQASGNTGEHGRLKWREVGGF